MTSMTVKPMRPGEVLCEEFMNPLGLSVYRVAKQFGSSAEFWMNP